MKAGRGCRISQSRRAEGGRGCASGSAGRIECRRYPRARSIRGESRASNRRRRCGRTLRRSCRPLEWRAPPSPAIGPSGLPKSPSVPTSRLTDGFCDFSASSMVFELTPSSSALIMREIDPFDDIEPLHVVLPHDRTKRLLRDDVRQDHAVARLGQLQADREQRRFVGRHHIALSGLVGGDHIGGACLRGRSRISYGWSRRSR